MENQGWGGGGRVSFDDDVDLGGGLTLGAPTPLAIM